MEARQTEGQVCAACGIEIDPEREQVTLLDSRLYCAWCWCNDCCRVTRDAAEEKEKNLPCNPANDCTLNLGR